MNRPAHSPSSMRCGLESLDQFDEIIDVRTPAEFADDHIPGAINAPVLSNEERVLIGTMYAQESPFKATRLGAALVARHIAEYLETCFADRPQSWRPLIYCWRGGKRSGAMTTWFNLIGWRARQLEGGYKTWRRHVLTSLESLPEPLRCIVLTGPTGSGKTRLLQALGRAGAQVLDLEDLASHRGSLLGQLPNQAQPSQRYFETRLQQAIEALDPNQPVFVEAESRRIGRVSLPDALLQKMYTGQCVQVKVAMPQRIAFLLQDYRHLFDQPETFKATLDRLLGLQSHETLKRWHHLIDTDQRAELFQCLVSEHYDPAYRRSSHGHYAQLEHAPQFGYDPTDAEESHQAHALLQALAGHGRPEPISSTSP
ncbi:tRNA 2-selenouridine(34) synthase MnmH [Castellaniella sp. FW104-16D08]|uniref:tRNA 2-selenouridine(34) synthase MnmH n=1 Tax=unclassified Castellaniella TaxID=2617606 RepID=UPI0033149D85